MSKIHVPAPGAIELRAQRAVERNVEFIEKAVRKHLERCGRREIVLHGHPRGGVPAAYLVGQAITRVMGRGISVEYTTQPVLADIIVDDLVDSGQTFTRLRVQYPHKLIVALYNKQQPEDADKGWIVFPWEATAEQSAEDIVVRLLQFVGEDVKRGGLLETPKRVIKAWQHWTSGYTQKPEDVLKTFEDGGENYDEMVTVVDIPFYSHCEHHLAPFFGTATISYIPNRRIVGLSKLSRLLNVFARRLQVQERLTAQVADALVEHLAPKGVGVAIHARHMCMESRGVCQQGHYTTTTALRGVIMNKPASRAEFLAIAKKK